MAALLVAVLVASAVAASAASAAKPQFILPAGEPFPVGFTATFGAGTTETVGGTTRTANGGTAVGRLIDSKEAEITITWTGYKEFGFACTTNGQPSGTVKTNPLKSYLVYNVGKTKVLDLLYPATEAFPPAEPPNGGKVAEFSCLGIPEVWRGSLLGQFPTINAFLNKTELVLKQTKGVQEFTEYETKAGAKRKAFLESSTNGGSFEQLGLTTGDTITLGGGRTVKIEG